MSEQKRTRGGFHAAALLFSFTVALQRLRLSVLYVYSIMKQVWYNDHQIWIRSFTAEEGIYSGDYCERAELHDNPRPGWRMPEHHTHTHTPLDTLIDFVTRLLDFLRSDEEDSHLGFLPV